MSVQIPPTVPAGWAPSWNEQYQTWYYINTKSKQSQWEKPTSPVATRPPSPARDGDGDDKLSPLVASAASEVDKMSAQFESTQIESSQQGTVAGSAPPEVPAGWLAKWNESYQTWFYYNMVTKGSTWERPTVPVEGASSTSTTTVSHAVTTTAATATAAAAPQVGESAAPRSSRVTASEPVSREPSSKEPQSREETPIVPNGWSAQWNDMYRAWFYVNTVTEETTWECPALTVDRPAPVTPAPSSNAHRPPPSLSPQPSLSGRASVHSQGPSGVPEVPSGWAARFNDQYQTWFYVNTHTGKSSWERPTAPASAPEDTPPAAQQQQPAKHALSAATQSPLRDETRSLAANAAAAAAPRGDPDLPGGWTKRFNEQYQTWFYVNLQTHQSQWDKPTIPNISVDNAAAGPSSYASDEELARRLQAEEDGLERESAPLLPPRPVRDAAASSPQPADLQRQVSSPGAFPGPGQDQPPSYEFAVGQHERSVSHGGLSGSNLQPYYPSHYAQNLHPPISPASSRPTSASGNSTLAPPGKNGQKPKKKRSWMLPAGVAAGGVAGLGVLGAGIYALTGSDIGDRIIDKVTGDGDDGEEEVVASFMGDIADAAYGG